MVYYTSIEQSKNLLKLGVSPANINISVNKNDAIEGFLPCWSLGALLEACPYQRIH